MKMEDVDEQTAFENQSFSEGFLPTIMRKNHTYKQNFGSNKLLECARGISSSTTGTLTMAIAKQIRHTMMRNVFHETKRWDHHGGHKTVPMSLANKRGENDEFAFYPVKHEHCSSNLVKTIKITKMAGVTWAKPWFTKSKFFFVPWLCCFSLIRLLVISRAQLHEPECYHNNIDDKDEAVLISTPREAKPLWII